MKRERGLGDRYPEEAKQLVCPFNIPTGQYCIAECCMAWVTTGREILKYKEVAKNDGKGWNWIESEPVTKDFGTCKLIFKEKDNG